MSEVINKLSFLKGYTGKKISTIIAMSDLLSSHLVSDEVTINLDDCSQLVICCRNDITDMFFQTDEDVVFSIVEDMNHTPYCNICDMNMSPILVDEEIENISIVYDEVSFVDKSNSDKTREYLLGVFIRTESRRIGICKDVLSATCLYADFENGTPSLIFPIDEKWGDIEKVNPFRVKRITWDISNDKHSIIEEKTYS